MNSLREDRFFSSIPFVTQENFYQSHFLQLYDETQREPETTTVIKSLHDLEDGSQKYLKIIQDIQMTPDEHDVIRVYTSNIEVDSQTFYNHLNEQLCKDNKPTLRHLMPFIRRATYQINRHAPPHECVAYRGMNLNNKQRAYFKTGTIFRFPGFTSTSRSKRLAESFGNTLFEIHIYAGCLQVRDVSDISHFPNENEYLFSPYSLFKVIDIKEKMIILRAIDNMSKVGMNNHQPSTSTLSSETIGSSSNDKSSISTLPSKTTKSSSNDKSSTSTLLSKTTGPSSNHQPSTSTLSSETTGSSSNDKSSTSTLPSKTTKSSSNDKSSTSALSSKKPASSPKRKKKSIKGREKDFIF
jgi:hypothetical protein